MVRACVLLSSGVISSGWEKKTYLPAVDVPVDGVGDCYCCSIPSMIVVLHVLVARDKKYFQRMMFRIFRMTFYIILSERLYISQKQKLVHKPI